EAAVGRSVDEALQSELAVRTERQARVVLERDADFAVGPGLEAVGLEDHLADLRGNLRAFTHDERGARRDLDSSGGSPLLSESRCGDREHQRENADPRSRTGHMASWHMKHTRLRTSAKD